MPDFQGLAWYGLAWVCTESVSTTKKQKQQLHNISVHITIKLFKFGTVLRRQ
jgi:hypothetical protein